MMKAIWNGKLLALSDKTVRVERAYYFPKSSLRMEFFRPSVSRRPDPWLGMAHFYDIVVDGKINADAAWYFPKPKPQGKAVEGKIAFARNVEVAKE